MPFKRNFNIIYRSLCQTDETSIFTGKKSSLFLLFSNYQHFLLYFRSTAELESFNNLILMYAGKRFSYTPPVYRARCILAAIDHNHNLQRPVLLNKQGEERYLFRIVCVTYFSVVTQTNHLPSYLTELIPSSDQMLCYFAKKK